MESPSNKTSLFRPQPLIKHKNMQTPGFDNKFILTTVFLLVLVYNFVEKVYLYVSILQPEKELLDFSLNDQPES